MKTLLTLIFVVFAISVQAQITSTFDTDDDGWTFLNSTTPVIPDHSVAGGNPGGFISATYSGNISFATQNWIAPAKFHGNHLIHSFGMNLSFDLQQSPAGTNSNVNGDVRIETTSGALVYSLPTKPATAPAWSSYSLKLDETQGWRFNATNGTLATRDQIKSILRNITSLEIRGTYVTNASCFSGLDNVVLEQRTLPVAPAITSFTPTSENADATVTITGNNFSATASNNDVYFGLVRAVVDNASPTQITVTVPVSASHDKITVINKVTGLSQTSRMPFNPTFYGGGRIIPASFAPRVDLFFSFDQKGFSMVDIDSDGWVDLAGASNSSDAVEIYRNLGLGGDITTASFAARLSINMPGSSTNGTGLGFADLDGDGLIDMVSSSGTSAFSAAFITFRNISTPGNIAFELPEIWTASSDESPIAHIADLDGDGRPELMGGEGSLSSNGSTYFWADQNMSVPGDIEFGPAIGFFNGSVINGFSTVTTDDLDGDGKNELLVTHDQGGSFTVLRNISTPGLPAFENTFTISNGITSLTAADVNMDGKNDLLWKTGLAGDIHIRLNTNSGGPLSLSDFASEVILTGDVAGYGGLSISDINGDDKPDIVSTDATDIGVFENVFSGGTFDANAFVKAYQYSGGGANTYPTSPRAADLNGDNKPDLIFATTNGSPSRLSILENRNIHAPVISVNTISPLKGPVGSTVTITGNNFSSIQSEVWFGAVKANVIEGSSNTLIVEVPAGATYAPVSVTKNALTSRYHLPFRITFGSGVTFDNTHFAPPISYTLTGANYDIEVGDLNNDGTVDILAEAGGIGYVFRNDYAGGAITTSTLVANDTLGPVAQLFGNPRIEDFDGDGYLDVASINTRIRRNISTASNITFTPNVTFAGQGNLAYSDFNQDGKIDLAISNSGAGQLLLVENRTTPGDFTTTGTFGSFSATFAFGKPGVGGEVTAADFDADGFPDAVTVNPTTDNISLFRNSGDKRISATQFGSRVDIAVGDNPSRIYKGDFDGDGKLDLMLYHGAGTTTTLLIVLQNTSTVGNISFSRIDLTNPAATTVAHLADLDGDGKPEILTTAEAGNQFSIFKNIHTSGVITAASFAAPFNTTVTAPRGIATADINLDGKPEIIVTRASGLLLVYENLISTIAVPAIISFTPTSGPIGTTVTITGINFSTTPSDNIVFFGATQATVSASTSTQLTVTVPAGATYESISVLVSGLTAYSSKPFIVTFPDGGVINSCSFAAKVDITAGTKPYSIAIGDLDGDGKPDLAIANESSNTISVFRNISSLGSLTTGSFAAKVDFATNAKPYYVGIQDLDGDGKPELIVSNNDDDNVSIYKNITTTGVINASSFAPQIDFTTGENPWNGTIDDFDLDGKPDLAIVNDVGNSVSILRNTSTMGTINSASFAPKVDFATGNFPIGIASGDLDGDGRADIVATNQTDNSVSVLRNTSTLGSISFAAEADLATGLDPYSVTIGDLDGKGKPEVIVANFSSGTASVYNNTSTSGVITLSAKVDFDSGSGSLTVALNDIDGDGKIDLTVTNGGNRISVLKNINSSAPIIATSFSPRVDFQATNLPYGFVLGDLDGNGKPDIAAANSNGTTVSLLRNTVTSLPPFTASSFSPTSGSIGTVVTLTGTNFSTTPINNTVKFNGIVATVTASTSTSITAIVPTGATTGPISLEIGCTTAITVIPFTVTAGSTITFTTQPSDRMMCAGLIATFTVEATGTTNMVYQWQKFDGVLFTDLTNGGGYSGVNTSVLSINTAGNFGEGDYRCTVSGDNAASVFSQSALLSFTTNSTIAEITVNGTTLTASSGDSYQWYQNGDAVDGATSQSFEFNVLEYGKYKVDVTDNGCTSTSEEFEYLITGIENWSDGIKMYPNPVEKILSTEYHPPYSITIINPAGMIVEKTNSNTTRASVDFSSFASGIYILQLKNEKGISYHRITKK